MAKTQKNRFTDITVDEAKLREKLRFTPREDQEKVLDAFTEHPEVLLACGVRYGKSILAAYIALREFVRSEKRIAEWMKNKEGDRPKPAKIWVVAPTYGLTEKVIDYIFPWFFTLFPDQSAAVTTRPNPRIKGPYGTIIEGKSAENEKSLMGDEIDVAILDECSRLGSDVWERYVKARLMIRNGKVIFISTPFGQNWFYRKWLQLDPKGAAFNYPSNVNPEMQGDKWEEVKESLPDQVFKQEYLASFLPDASAVFRGVLDIVRDGVLRDAEQGASYILGVDLAKHEDFTVLTMIDRATKEVVFFDRFSKVDYPLQRARIVALSKRYNHSRIIVDSTGIGTPIKEELERDGVVVDDYYFTNKSKKELVEKLSIHIEQGNIAIPDEPNLVKELHAFGYQLTEHGNVRYGAPSGFHDDCVISLALAVWGLAPGSPRKRKPPMTEFILDKTQPKPKAKRLI